MFNYDETIIVLKNYAFELAQDYIRAKQHEIENYDANFAFNIINTLNKYKQNLLLLNKIHRHDLLDSIEAHTDRYLASMINCEFAQKNINQYKLGIAEITNFLKEHNKSIEETNVDNHEPDPLRLKMNKITNNIRLLLAQKNHNIAAADRLQACNIVYAIDSIDYNNQEDLIEKLLLVKEIWSIENLNDAQNQSIKYKFQNNIAHFINGDFNNSIGVFNYLINLLSNSYSTLPNLTDQQIINLYNRLRNHELSNEHIVTLIDRIQKEARIRYSYNRLSDSEYELINLFQNLDTLVFHQGKLKFGIIKAYLLHKENFAERLINLLLEQADNIRAFSLNNDEILISILKRINLALTTEDSANENEQLINLRNILSTCLEINIQKKYSNLDKYTMLTLVRKYTNLFSQIEQLLNNDDSSKLFLREGFIKMITKEFHLHNLSNSVEKIRQSSFEKEKIKEVLMKLHLEEIFINNGVNNEIKDLDFKQISNHSDIKKSDDYIRHILKYIVSISNASQLNILYKPQLSESKSSEFQLYLRQEIKNEIISRTSFSKMIKAIFTGNKKEYDQLCNLKKTTY